MILFAHRGASAHAPENTLEAFVLARTMGATGLESDVWVTRDGVAVLDHDGFADTGRSVHIADVDRSALPPHIPSLADLYAACGTAFELSLDLKDPAALEPSLAAARQADAAERLWLCHHRWRELAAWRSAAHDVRLVDSTYVGFMSGGPEQRADRLVASGIDAVNLHHSEWDVDRVDVFRSVGLRCLAWDAQDPMTLRRLVELDVDGVFGDHVDRMIAAVAARDGAHDSR